MRGLSLFLCLIFLGSLAATHAQRGKKPPELQVVEAKARRIEDKVAVDGTVRITAEKPVRGLVLAFDFLDHDNAVLTSEQDQISEDALESGETASFRSETLNPPGAIKFKIRAFDSSQKELRIANAGPFVIE